jgi:hypothetical protein
VKVTRLAQLSGNQRLQAAIRPPLAERVIHRVEASDIRPGDADGLLDLGKIIRQYPHPSVLTGCRLQRLSDAGDHIPFTGEEGVDGLLRGGKAIQAGVLQMTG